MSKSKSKKFTLVACAACLILTNTSIYADAFSLKDGTTQEGQITSIQSEIVTISLNSGESIQSDLSNYDEASLTKINAWIDENQEKVNVFTKWDTQPVVKRSNKPELPEALNQPEFKGLVSLQVVLDEKGRVIHGEIRKSTHPELEQPAIDAAKRWIFTPAKIASKPVKAKLNLSFKYEYEPSIF